MATAENNFSRVSERDALAFGSSRPGFPSKSVTADDVQAWVQFMLDKGIKRVLSLLGDDEAEEYYPGINIDQLMTEAFGSDNYTRTSVFVPTARTTMSDALAAAKIASEPIVMHCSGGEGRAALAMGLWLVDSYGLAPTDACREIDEETGRNEGIARRTSAAKLAHLVECGTMTGFKK